MIHEVKRKIHFSEYLPERGRGKNTDAPPTVTINIKANSIRFGTRTIAVLGMEGKFISFYYEATKKIVGWIVTDNLSEAQLKLKKHRLVTANSRNGSYATTIAGILQQFHGLAKETYKNLEVQKYVEKEGVLSKGDTYFFVQLSDTYEDLEQL